MASCEARTAGWTTGGETLHVASDRHARVVVRNDHLLPRSVEIVEFIGHRYEDGLPVPPDHKAVKEEHTDFRYRCRGRALLQNYWPTSSTLERT